MPSVIKNRCELQDYLKHRRPLTDGNHSLGMLLLESGQLTMEQLQQALTYQHQHPDKGRLGQILIDLGMLSQERLSQTLAEQLGIPHVLLEHFEIDPDCSRSMPESLARHYLAVPLLLESERLVVATPDPTNQDLLHLLGFATGKGS